MKLLTLLSSVTLIIVLALCVAPQATGWSLRHLDHEESTCNCPAVNGCGFGGINCTEASQCCGDGTMEPLCVHDGHQCCTWYLDATSCKATQSCCGQLGPGASSNAFCCEAESTCCQTTADGESQCCGEDEICCRGFNSVCCNKNESCGTGVKAGQCVKK